MSSFVWMKVLESAPQRYDDGIQMLSAGRIGEVYDSIAAVARPGARVLDIGCGTGALSLRCAAKGAQVVGIDINAGMLEIARQKPVKGTGSVEWVEAGVAEMEDHFQPGSFDAIVSCLVFSELSVDEQNYALATSYDLLRGGGHLVIADEIEPTAAAKRAWQRLRRVPRTVAAYLLTQTTTRPVSELASRVSDAAFEDVAEERIWSETFAIVRAHKQEEPP